MYQSTSIEGEIWDAEGVEEVGGFVDDDRTVEIELVSAPGAPEK